MKNHIDTLRQLVLSFPETTEEPHFDKISFRVKKKIFATYDDKNHTASVKLSLIDQDVFSFDDAVYPVPNKWGKQGWTLVELDRIKNEILKDIIITAYCNTAPEIYAGQVRRQNDDELTM